MILSGQAIRTAVQAGEITITPFEPAQIGPNSYDFRLGDRCKVYQDTVLDVSKYNPTDDFTIDDRGLVLEPGRVYLLNTLETIGSTRFVPIIRGRSSVGRLGLFINITADLIDLGSVNQLTLQLSAVLPIKIFPGMLVAQVTFWTVRGEIDLYRGKYGRILSPSGSLSYYEFQGGL